MKAILIDPEAKTITEVEHNGNFREIYKFIGCECFTTVSIGSPPDGKKLQHNGRENHVFVDDEGLLNSPRHFFHWKGYEQPLAGKGLILGCDEEGETVATTWSVKDVEAMVTYAQYSVLGFENIPEHKEMHYGKEFTVIGHVPVFGLPESGEPTKD